MNAFMFGQLAREKTADNVGGLFGRAGYFDTMKDMYWDKGLSKLPGAAANAGSAANEFLARNTGFAVPTHMGAMADEYGRTFNPYHPQFSEPAKDNLEHALRFGARASAGTGVGAAALAGGIAAAPALPYVAGVGLPVAAGVGGAMMTTPPPETAPAPAGDGKQTTNSFNVDPQMAAYGLGGAGAGALLGAAMGRKGTRGRNALIGAGLGGGAGLLAQHFMNKKTAAEEKQAVGMMDGMKNFAVDMAQAQGASRGQMLGLAGGGGLGGLAGALYGAYNPGAKAVLDENGNPTMKRRSRLMGALRGGLGGAALGAGVGNFAGHHVGGMYGRQQALQAMNKQSESLLPLSQGLYDNVGVPTVFGAGVGGLYGALTAPKKQLLRSVLRGATIGGAAGAGAGAAGLGTANIATDSALQPKNPEFHDGFGAGITTGMGASGGGLLSGLLAKRVLDEYAPIKETTKEKEKTSAFNFGEMLGNAGQTLGNAGRELKNMYGKLPEGVRSGIGMGGIGGAALGGLAGLVAPGEDVEYDNMGREVRRNPRSRFGAMMRGAVGGGLAGAAGGAAAGHFAPQQTQQAANYLRQQGHNLHQK